MRYVLGPDSNLVKSYYSSWHVAVKTFGQRYSPRPPHVPLVRVLELLVGGNYACLESAVRWSWTTSAFGCVPELWRQLPCFGCQYRPIREPCSEYALFILESTCCQASISAKILRLRKTMVSGWLDQSSSRRPTCTLHCVRSRRTVNGDFRTGKPVNPAIAVGSWLFLPASYLSIRVCLKSLMASPWLYVGFGRWWLFQGTRKGSSMDYCPL